MMEVESYLLWYIMTLVDASNAIQSTILNDPTLMSLLAGYTMTHAAVRIVHRSTILGVQALSGLLTSGSTRTSGRGCSTLIALAWPPGYVNIAWPVHCRASIDGAACL
jgi:hypothetical protein